jgi:anti-sigma regulatory factor (Ser/Thr protein kinase)
MPFLTARDAQTTLPVTGTAASSARAFTKRALAEWQLAEFEETAVLLVSELTGNVIRHAPGSAAILRLRAGAGWLRIEVSDSDPRLPVPRTPGELDESGFGFILIEALVAKWGVNQAPGGKTVWAELTAHTRMRSRHESASQRRRFGAVPGLLLAPHPSEDTV